MENECQKCGYEWTSRIKSPKECPDCKSRRWNDCPHEDFERVKGKKIICKGCGKEGEILAETVLSEK